MHRQRRRIDASTRPTLPRHVSLVLLVWIGLSASSSSCHTTILAWQLQLPSRPSRRCCQYSHFSSSTTTTAIDRLFDASRRRRSYTSASDSSSTTCLLATRDKPTRQRQRSANATRFFSSGKAATTATSAKQTSSRPAQQSKDKTTTRVSSPSLSNTTATSNAPFSRDQLEQQVQELRELNRNATTTSSSSSSSHPVNATPVVTRAACDAVWAQCVAADAWDAVLDVRAVMQRNGWSPTHDTYTASLQACLAAGNAAAAYEIHDAMQAAGIALHATDLGYLVSTLCRRARLENAWYTTALQVLADAQTSSRTTSNNNDYSIYDDLPNSAVEAVLREMAHRREWKRALRLLQTMLDRQRQPSKQTFRWTMEACLWSGQPELAAQILSSSLTLTASYNKKEDDGSNDQDESYSSYTTQALFASVITGLSKKQHWRKALQMLDLLEEQPREAGLQTTLQMYNSIMVALGKAKEWSQARRLMRRLKNQDHLRPDILTYNSLMAAAARRWKDALIVLDECHREPGVEPDVYTYTAAIRACAKGGKISRALTLLQVVQDKELPLDAFVYTAAMEACAKGKLWQRALELLQEMQDKGIDPSQQTYSVAITACGNAGEWERSLELLEIMRTKGLSPNLITYNGAIAAIAKSAKHLSKDGAHVGKSSGDRWKHVQSLLGQMRADGLEPDGFSYSSAISCYGFEGRWEEALELIEKMRKGGPAMRPNKIAYTAAISSCGRNGQDEHALKLFAQMKHEGLESDRVAYNALFSALRVAKRADVALDLWEEMIGVAPDRLSIKRVATARSDDAARPDIITVTDAIGALSADESTKGKASVDKVLQEAVDRGILLRNNRLDSLWEVDLSGMSLPVARAATRYILRQISTLLVDDAQVQDLTIITGVGVGKERSTSLREYIQEILLRDFDPQLDSSIPKRAQGTVVVEASVLKKWLVTQQDKARQQ